MGSKIDGRLEELPCGGKDLCRLHVLEAALLQ